MSELLFVTLNYSARCNNWKNNYLIFASIEGALDRGKDKLKEWWNPNSQAWVKKLQSLILQYRNIGHQWQFSKQQKEVLQQYYAANQLLMDCLNSGCEVTSTVRDKIEETLLLPMAESDNLVSMFVL